jgi:hypothetical protein
MQSLLTFIQTETENSKENQNDNKFLSFLRLNKTYLKQLELVLSANTPEERLKIYNE